MVFFATLAAVFVFQVVCKERVFVALAFSVSIFVAVFLGCHRHCLTSAVCPTAPPRTKR